MYNTTMLGNFIFVLFSISFTIYFIAVLERWPYVARFNSLYKKKAKNITGEDCIEKDCIETDNGQVLKDDYENRATNSKKIMVSSWIILFVEILVIVYLASQYFYYIKNKSFACIDLVVFSLAAFVFFITPKFFCGFIHGFTMWLCPIEFGCGLKNAYESNRTMEEFHLAKWEARRYLIEDNNDIKPNKRYIKKSGKNKSVGNLFFIVGCCMFLYFVPVDLLMALIMLIMGFIAGMLPGKLENDS